jgi:hypothetical protein
MLGNLGFSVPIHQRGGRAPEDDATRHVFTSGGKMIREAHGRQVAPQNTTISAILVLCRVPVGERLFWADLRKREADRGKPFGREEIWAHLIHARRTEHDVTRKQLRVVVHENPYARIALCADLFRGPYDERYSGVDGRVQRVFRGEALAALPETRD